MTSEEGLGGRPRGPCPGQASQQLRDRPSSKPEAADDFSVQLQVGLTRVHRGKAPGAWMGGETHLPGLPWAQGHGARAVPRPAAMFGLSPGPTHCPRLPSLLALTTRLRRGGAGRWAAWPRPRPPSTRLQAPPTQAPPTTAVPGASLAVVQRGRALRSGKVTRGGALGSVFFVPGTAEAGPAVPPTASPGGRSSWHLLPPRRVNYSPAPGWPARRETRAL